MQFFIVNVLRMTNSLYISKDIYQPSYSFQRYQSYHADMQYDIFFFDKTVRDFLFQRLVPIHYLYAKGPNE